MSKQKMADKTKKCNLIILSLLKAFINGQQNIEIPPNVDWNSIKRLTDINSISGIVGSVLEQADAEDIPQEIQQGFSDDFYSTIIVSTMRNDAMTVLQEQLDSCGIDYLLFKGLIIKDLYPILELRTFGDIDFAIHAPDRERCHSLMLKLGYQVHDDWEPVYSYQKDYESYEIHTQLLDSNLNDKANYQEFFHDFWEHTVQRGCHSYVLDPEYHLLFLLVHIAKHLYGSGAGIRMYLDIALYLRAYRTEIDWDHFQKNVETLNLSKFVNNVFTAVKQWFDIDSPILLNHVDKAFLDEFLTFSFNGGVFGYNGEAAKLSQVRKNSQGHSVKRVDTLLKRAFPSADSIKSRYTYLNSKPWLLPVAWIHRFVIKKHSSKTYLKESKKILSTNKKDVIELNRFYQNLGL